MRLIPRHIRPSLIDALADSRIACLLGPRQAGKSTLIRTHVQDLDFALKLGDLSVRVITIDEVIATGLDRH